MKELKKELKKKTKYVHHLETEVSAIHQICKEQKFNIYAYKISDPASLGSSSSSSSV